ncbi:hypothetical protein HOE67_05160 [Candidatus Peregrinibacteria bacterium]|jgi:hypothetical protein|nr:hypothetical protein [Candidatus Peregrinibacteria bacterium]MBT4056471.1 hypothetical protein [Candidatus Peregrinibacteria bacterium]
MGLAGQKSDGTGDGVEEIKPSHKEPMEAPKGLAPVAVEILKGYLMHPQNIAFKEKIREPYNRLNDLENAYKIDRMTS